MSGTFVILLDLERFQGYCFSNGVSISWSKLPLILTVSRCSSQFKRLRPTSRASSLCHNLRKEQPTVSQS